MHILSLQMFLYMMQSYVVKYGWLQHILIFFKTVAEGLSY